VISTELAEAAGAEPKVSAATATAAAVDRNNERIVASLRSRKARVLSGPGNRDDATGASTPQPVVELAGSSWSLLTSAAHHWIRRFDLGVVLFDIDEHVWRGIHYQAGTQNRGTRSALTIRQSRPCRKHSKFEPGAGNPGDAAEPITARVLLA
jgi:hypothetical protein